jgi:large subunit ribosomal protein L25
MEKTVLKAQLRPANKTAKAIRREGLLPAVMYGHHYPSTAIVLNMHEASLLIPRLSSSAIVTIDLNGETQSALIREKQKDYVRNALIHIDFQVVSMTEKIRTSVQVDFTGISPAVKDYNGVVVTNMNTIDVESLPQYLPERIVVDLSTLTQIGSSVHVRDLKVAKEVTIHHGADEVIAVVAATKDETEAPITGEMLEPEVIERGKKTEEDID